MTLLLTLAACSGGGEGPTTPPPEAAVPLRWASTLDSLEEGATALRDGFARATGAPRYTVDDTTLATIDPATGRLTALQVGTVTVTVTTGTASLRRPVRITESPRTLQLNWTAPLAGVFTEDDSARVLTARVVTRTRLVRPLPAGTTVTLVAAMAPHGSDVLTVTPAAPVAGGGQAWRIGPGRRGYWRGWAVVAGGGLRDSIPLRSTGYLAGFVFEPTRATFPASPLARALADSAWRVWAQYVMDTLPRRTLPLMGYTGLVSLNLWPNAAQQLANTNRVMIFTASGAFARALGGASGGVLGADPRRVVGSVSLDTSLARDAALTGSTLVHEFGHVLGIGDHPRCTRTVVVVDLPAGGRGATLPFASALAALRREGVAFPGWVQGFPLTPDRGHWANAAAEDDIMNGTGTTLAADRVTTLSLRALRELGYQIDLAGAPLPRPRNTGEGWFTP